MKSFLKSLIAGLLAVALTGPVAVAEERPAYSEEELDQMLAPIALYPDSLLSQVLMASTYPLEVVQAARWSRANPQLKGDDAVKAVEGMDWDPSVKSLVAFPQILYRMDERIDWTQRLGEAFLAQEPHVLDAIQGLRQKAAVAGNLNSNEQMRVTRQDEAIVIEQARPEAVYVPYYNPAVVYGPWAWTGYPPVYWGPFPGYYAAPAFSPAFFWGPAIVVSTGFFFGHCNWHQRHVTVVQKTVVTRYGKPHAVVPPHARPVAWQHNPVHRKGVPYRQASLRDQYGQPGRGWHGGDGRGDHRGPGSAPGARDGTARPSPQAGNNAPDGRGKPGFDSGSRRPGAAAPAVPGNDRRSGADRDNSRFQDRASRPASPAPATRQAQRPDSSGSGNVLRFPTPASAPGRQAQHQDANGGNNVYRFQGHMPAPRPAPSAPAARQNQRPAVAAPQRSAQQASGGQQQFRVPQASPGARGETYRQVMAPQRGAPAPQARVGHSVPRAANGNFRGNAAAGGRGGSVR